MNFFQIGVIRAMQQILGTNIRCYLKISICNAKSLPIHQFNTMSYNFQLIFNPLIDKFEKDSTVIVIISKIDFFSIHRGKRIHKMK